MTHQDKPEAERGTVKNAHRVATPSDSQDSVADAVQDQVKTAQDRAKEALGTAEKQAGALLAEAKERLAPLDSWVKMTTQEHPYVAVSSAMGVSFLAGFLMRRRAAVGLGVAIGFLGGCLISGSGARAARQPRKV